MPFTTATRVTLAGSALCLVAATAAPALAADATTSTAATTTAATTISSTSVLRLEDVRAAGLVKADTGAFDATGDVLLGDAGRFDEGCLGEKSMRNMTNSKAYPSASAALGFYGVTWSSTLDKEVWVREAITQAPSLSEAKRYVANVSRAVASVKDCQQDPAQGQDYRAPKTFLVGAATVTFWVDENADGTTDGGGTAVVRRGTKVAFVDLLAGTTHAGSTLRALATAAAQRLG